MQISEDFCRLSGCNSNPDNCGYYPRDCVTESLYVTLNKLIERNTKYSYMGISQSLSNGDIKEAVKLLSIIEGMNK